MIIIFLNEDNIKFFRRYNFIKQKDRKNNQYSYYHLFDIIILFKKLNKGGSSSSARTGGNRSSEELRANIYNLHGDLL